VIRRLGAALIGPALGAALAFAVLLGGPSAAVVCDRGHVLNRVAQDLSGRFGSGHIDGPRGEFCTVPADSTWVTAGVVFVVVVLTVFVLRGSSRSRPRRPVGPA
jgi:hypothetical protein